LIKHYFYYFTDSLVAYTSWHMSWRIWSEEIGKDEDDYTLTGMQMNTHMGTMYLGKAAIHLTEKEYELFEEGS